MRYPLDHVFASQHFFLVELRPLPDIGSDHFPLFARGLADEDSHRHAIENLVRADALLFGQVTYEMMEAESACGRCKDKWGLSWQITPLALTEAITGPDPAAAKRGFDTMMTMRKIDISTIEAALRG